MVSNQTLNRRNGNYENVYLFESTDELDHAPRIIFIDDNSFTIKTWALSNTHFDNFIFIFLMNIVSNHFVCYM